MCGSAGVNFGEFRVASPSVIRIPERRDIRYTYFWAGASLKKGNHVTVQFQAPTELEALEVRFGRRERRTGTDFLRNGKLQVARCSHIVDDFDEKDCRKGCLT